MGSVKRPVTLARPSTTETFKPVLAGKQKMLSVDVPEEVHRSLRMESARTGKTVRELVLAALAAQGHPNLPDEPTGRGGGR